MLIIGQWQHWKNFIIVVKNFKPYKVFECVFDASLLFPSLWLSEL